MPPPSLLADMITHWPELYYRASRLAIRPQASPVPTSLKLGLQAYLPYLAFIKSYGDLNPGPRAYAASTVPTESPVQLLTIYSSTKLLLSYPGKASLSSQLSSALPFVHVTP